MEKNKVNMVWKLLKYTYGILPIVAGIDKFFNLLVDWQIYLNPILVKLLPVSPLTFMYIVGIIEILVGIIILIGYTRIGAYIASIWLLLIAINLIEAGYYDIALRDIVIAIGAFALAKLDEHRQEITERVAARR
jgi:uncharacterized membrane protein YphA (DoxX/SURF4 family)